MAVFSFFCESENVYLVGARMPATFVKYRLFYRAFLQKRPIILRSLLIVATPYLVGVRLLPTLAKEPYKRVYVLQRDL